MIFKVENLGVIQHAEIDLGKDLILFCGHNNTGKTYLSYVIYLILDRNKLKSAALIPPLTTYLDEIKKQAEQDKKGSVLIDLVKLFDEYGEHGRNELIQAALHMDFIELAPVFGLPKYSFNQSLNPKFQFKCSHDEINDKLLASVFTLKAVNSAWKVSKGENSPMLLCTGELTQLFTIFPHIVMEAIIVALSSRRFFFPVERNAIGLFSKELSIIRNKLFTTLLKVDEQAASEVVKLARDHVDRYAKPIRDNLDIAVDLTNLAKNTSEFNHLAEELEKNVLGGKIHVSQYGDLNYSPDHAPNITLGMELSSSTVGSLSSLVFYLRHLAEKGDTLIIDEPELSLHPDNQRVIARFFGSLVNAGFKLIISTHSDYIVREINNLIMLSKKSRKTAGLRKKYGYTKEQVLQPQQVGAYLFKRGEPSPQSIEITETGLEISTIDEVVADLNQSSQDIYFSLFD